MSDMDHAFTYENTGFTAEHYFQRPGEPRRFYTHDYIAGVYRRAARRGNQLTDELILHSHGPVRPASAPLGITRKTTTPPRQCKACGDTFGPRTAAQVYFTNRCARKAAKERAA